MIVMLNLIYQIYKALCLIRPGKPARILNNPHLMYLVNKQTLQVQYIVASINFTWVYPTLTQLTSLTHLTQRTPDGHSPGSKGFILLWSVCTANNQ